jgi:penicillin-binding protein 1A
MRLLTALLSFGLVLAGLGAVLVAMVYAHYSKDLPDYSYLKDYQPPTLSRIYADDGRMMAVVAEEQRIFVPINAIPKRVKDAFLSAEDADFYQHGGVDYPGVIRAILVNLRNMGHDKHPMGASTITQQVAKNMLLTNEVSITRKMREAILATRLEKALSKDRILEIYLNEIFLGNHSYGVAAAALNYFNKSLDELTVDEAAYLAALPKGPNNYNPIREHAAAVARRNWVIGRMAETGHITKAEADAAQQQPLQVRMRDSEDSVQADYFSEEVRRQLIDKFGEDKVLQDGLAVKTSLDPKLQAFATKALHDGLVNFDRRERGWRGPVAHIPDFSDWQKRLKAIPVPAGGESWQLAVVYAFKGSETYIAFADGVRAHIPWPEMSWARRELANDEFGPPIRKPQDVVSIGDVVLVEQVKSDDAGKAYDADTYTLRQVPVVEGAIVVLDPHTGRVYALNGGFSAKMSQFDRATQAYRQPGSSFKPFVYMAALDKGFTPASLIMDSPFDYYQGPGLPLWHPENYDGEDFGPTPLRVGIEKSQNVMTVRIANAIGMPIVIDYAKKFGIVDDMPNYLAYSLGTKETTPLRMATAYGMIVNGGKKITPSLIDRVQDRDGKTIWRADSRDCTGCQSAGWTPQLTPPDLPDTREQVEDPRTAYQMVNILTGVVQRGTASRLHDIDYPLAGKTGTTNDSKDAWFVGFTPNLVCAVYVGFDNPIPLGSKETGASVAVPVFREFITQAIKGRPPIPFHVPPGLRMVRVNPHNEDLASPGEKDAIWESFIPGSEPQEGQTRTVLDGSVTGSASMGVGAMAPNGGAGGQASPATPAVDPSAPASEAPVVIPPDAPSGGMPSGADGGEQSPTQMAPTISGTGGLY